MGKKLTVTATDIPGVLTVRSNVYSDTRGEFSRWFCQHELQPIIGGEPIVQINNSFTMHAGCVRGLHFQYPPFSELKLIRCVRGAVWDMAVDLRFGSPTFLKHIALELNENIPLMVIIPKGVAHGFQTLKANSQLLYLHTEIYHPDSEGGINPNDPALNISWPLPIKDISARDRNFPYLKKAFEGINI